MSRMKDREIRAAAVIVRHYVDVTKGTLTNEDIRLGVRRAREAGEDIPQFVSERSMDMIEEAMVEL